MSAPSGRFTTLGGAIVSEVSATLALRAAVDTPAWYVVTATGYVAAFVLLSKTLGGGMPVGVAYGIWAAAGVALTAVLAVPLFGEDLSGAAVAGLGLIVVGVLLVELGGRPRPSRRDGPAVEEVGWTS